MVEVAQSGSASVGTKLRYEKNINEICLFFSNMLISFTKKTKSKSILYPRRIQTYDPKQCNPALYGEGNTMCKYTKDEPNERCKDGGVDIISRKVTEQVRYCCAFLQRHDYNIYFCI